MRIRLLSGFGRHLAALLRAVRGFAGGTAAGADVPSLDELRSDKHCSPAFRFGPILLAAGPAGMPVETVEHDDSVEAVSLSAKVTRRRLLVPAVAALSLEARLLPAEPLTELVEASPFIDVVVTVCVLRGRLLAVLISASAVENVAFTVRFLPCCRLVGAVTVAVADDFTGRGRSRLWPCVDTTVAVVVTGAVVSESAATYFALPLAAAAAAFSASCCALYAVKASTCA